MILDFLGEIYLFFKENIFYFIGFYIIVSIYGFYNMRNYVRNCYRNNIVPFNNSVIKMFSVSSVCGFFTTLVVIIGISMSIVEFFRKKG